MTLEEKALEAVSVIESGNRVFIHSAAATPQMLVKAMTARADKLKNVEIVSIHTEGEVPYADDKYSDSFSINCFFVGSNMRKHVQRGRANYIPIFLQEIPALFTSRRMPIDVALVTLSAPNPKGYCSLGCSVDVSNAAMDSAKYVIAEINSNMPFVHGNGVIHISQVDAFIKVDAPLFEIPVPAPTAVEAKIGRNVATLVEDGATLQMGIGGIPNATLNFLHGHKNLGVHSEMISDGIIDLAEKGIINGMNKVTEHGKIVAGFALGTKRIYDFIM